jgi:hypothetical protein
VPARAVPDLSAGLEVVGVRDLGDALRVLL